MGASEKEKRKVIPTHTGMSFTLVKTLIIAVMS